LESIFTTGERGVAAAAQAAAASAMATARA
jgi:hypothetical protein